MSFREKPNNEIAVGLGGLFRHSRRAYPFVALSCVIPFFGGCYKNLMMVAFAIIKIRFGRLKLCNSKYALDFYGATIASTMYMDMRLL